MAREAKTRQAIRMTRDTNGIVHMREGNNMMLARVRYDGKSVGLEADKLIRSDEGGHWIISPGSGKHDHLELY